MRLGEGMPGGVACLTLKVIREGVRIFNLMEVESVMVKDGTCVWRDASFRQKTAKNYIN